MAERAKQDGIRQEVGPAQDKVSRHDAPFWEADGDRRPGEAVAGAGGIDGCAELSTTGVRFR